MLVSIPSDLRGKVTFCNVNEGGVKFLEGVKVTEGLQKRFDEFKDYLEEQRRKMYED